MSTIPDDPDCSWARGAQYASAAWTAEWLGGYGVAPSAVPSLPTSYAAATPYMPEVNVDYPCDDRIGGFTNNCHDQICCEALCDDDPDCALYMFGNHPNGCQSCCWTKSVPTCSSITAAGVTTYHKPDVPQAADPGPSHFMPTTYNAEEYVEFPCDDLPGDANRCHDQICCEALCDDDPDCALYMFGNHPGGCQSCCWIKSEPTCSSITAAGVTTYHKPGVPNATDPGPSYPTPATYNIKANVDFECGDLISVNDDNCHDQSFCQDLCDYESNCAVFMVANECVTGQPCCWTKTEPTCSPSNVTGVTTYHKVPPPGH
ncbi:hypothetical protein FOA52_000362 [Chlamydomonas sp. UWO 241]|nr:hypothetical protein FOA52_000362 [Chlamydomonas sp. UWO 241]